MITEAQVASLVRLKHSDAARIGWSPLLRARFGYYTPDEWYEAAVWDAVTPGTDWLDVGCGWSPFPANKAATTAIVRRCGSLTGIDPSDNIDRNPYLHHRAKCTIEEFDTDQTFDVISLRMVVEHIVDPGRTVAALSRLCRPGGRVIVYTVNQWSPVSMVSAATPLAFHHWAKRLAWGGDEKDTFPTVYRMNTRRTLGGWFGRVGLMEESFRYLPDTRTTGRSRVLNTIELTVWKLLDKVGLRYPETALLGVYVKR